jgi:predicted secreted protein
MTTEAVLKPGETFTLPLTGRGSSGYSWSFEMSGTRGAVEVHIEGTALPPHRGSPPPIAGSAPEQLVVKALAPGKVSIQLKQQRSWERGKPPIDQLTLTIIVRERSK